jgi:DNA polymerase III gamma/tau subunit
MRIYRFSDLVGNKVTVSMLKRGLANNTLKNFLIFSGVMGTGKSTSAEIVGLSLTCENPVEGEACLECSSCKSNLKALRGSGTGLNLVKKNIARLKSKDDMNELVNEVFTLQGAVGNLVYIFEEIQELSQSNQNVLLDELDRLSENTYVILTTTRPYKLTPEIRSRAITYPFLRLSQQEAKILFEKVTTRMGISKIGVRAQNLILKYAKGIPRDIVKLIEFVRDNRPTEDELRVFLGSVSNAAFLDYFQSCLAGNIRDIKFSCDGLLTEHSLDTIIFQLKDFIGEVIFYLKEGTSEEFTKEETQIIDNIFNESIAFKISTMVEKLDGSYSEADFRLFSIRLSQVNKSKSSIFEEDSKRASEQRIEAQRVFREENTLRATNSYKGSKLISPDSLKAFDISE